MVEGKKTLVMGYSRNTFVELMGFVYIRYRKITPGDLMKNQDTMQAFYHVEDPIEIIFGQIKTGQEFAISGNPPFSDRHFADMGIAQILAMQEYTHAYRMWKIILANEFIWVRFKTHFHGAYFDW